MATAAKTVYPHITKDTQVCSGRACVEGTRIRVMDIVAMRRDGVSPERIVEEFTSLSGVEDVYAALLYYGITRTRSSPTSPKTRGWPKPLPDPHRRARPVRPGQSPEERRLARPPQRGRATVLLREDQTA
jgi:uncharacterized protein (DUF433 family)